MQKNKKVGSKDEFFVITNSNFVKNFKLQRNLCN